MCGIIYAHRKDNMPIGKTVFKRYQNQKARGSQGFGILSIEKNKVSNLLRFEQEADMSKALCDVKASHVLFHHRLPTSTPNYEDMTHPIVVKNKSLDYDYYVVHNGVIRNEHFLRDKHERAGFEYTTLMQEIKTVKTRNKKQELVVEKFNDSESLAIELALFFDGKQDTIGAVGSIAFVCLQVDKTGNIEKIHYGRNGGNPLTVEENGDLFFVKSIGEGTPVKENTITTIDVNTKERTVRNVDVGSIVAATHKTHEHKHRRVIGFGPTDEDQYDDEEDLSVTDAGFVLSPSEYLPATFRQHNLLSAGSSPRGEMSDMVDNIFANADGQFSGYQYTPEYLLELWGEIEEIELEIKNRKIAKNEGMLSSAEDELANDEAIQECCEVVNDKKVQAEKLKNYLEISGKY